MATYKEIQHYVKSNYGYVPKSCWIAHCKEMSGLAPRRSPRRYGERRVYPCPPERKATIVEAFRHFEMI